MFCVMLIALFVLLTHSLVHRAVEMIH